MTMPRNSSPSTPSRLHFEALEPRVLFDAAPDVAVVSGDTLIIDEAGVDEEISFNVVIENNGDQTGHVPYVDFAASPDITIQEVSSAGNNLTQGDGDPSTHPIGKIAADGQLVDITTDVPIDHPMFDPTGAGLTSDDFGGAGSGTPPVFYDVVTNPDLIGMYVYTAQLPSASQAAGSSGLNVTVIGTVDPDSVEPLVDYTVYAQGGYAFGQDASDNPGTVSAPSADPPIFTGAVSSETFTVTKMAATAEYIDLDFGNPVEATNGTRSLGSINVDYYDGLTMHFLNVATIGGQQIDARLSVTSVHPDYEFVGTMPDYSQGQGVPEGDLGYLYQSRPGATGVGGINYRLEFFVGGNTFADLYDIPYFGLMVYDVDGESTQSEEVRAHEEDGLVGYRLANSAGSVTATREPTSVRFTGPGTNRDETDASGAFIVYFANTSTVNLEMFSNTNTPSASGNPVFSAIDGDQSILNGDLSGFTEIIPVAPILRKTLADPSDTDFTIGEPVEYVIEIEVPDGRAGDPEAYILDAIDPGFSFIPGTLQVTLGTGVTVGTSGTLDESNSSFFVHTDPGSTALSEQLRFNFDWLDYNSAAPGTGGALSSTIEIRYQLQVENIASNQQGTTLNNRATLYYTDDAGTSLIDQADETGEDDTEITVVEPQVDAAKTITNVTNAAPGGTVSYQVTLTHPGDAGTNPLQNTAAYDVTFADDLPDELQLQTGTFTATLNGTTDVSSWFTVTAGGVVNNAGISIDLDPGDQIVITYDATIIAGVRNNQDIENEVDVEWTTLDGTETGERTGDSDFDNPATGVDDYESDASASLTTSFPRVYAFTKTIASTSESHTGTAFGTAPTIEDLVIGETVTFRLTATMADGLTDNVQILDTLSIANGLLDIRSVTVTAGSALTRQDGNPWDNDVTISDTLGGSDGYNDGVQIDFGNVINDATGYGADEQIVVLIEAVVVNNVANQAGDVITNTGTLNYENDIDNDGTPDAQSISDTADVEIVEPTVTVTKTIPSPPANPESGSDVGYQIVLENTSNTDAFDLTFRDLLPTEMDLQTGTFTATRLSDGGDVSAFFTVTADEINHAASFDLEAGDRITITYDARITPLVTDGLSLTNEADVEWTSTDGVNADERGGDGDFDNPAAGVDDYESEDDATIVTDLAYGFSKTISSTSETHTGSAGGTDAGITDLVIGETATFLLTAQLGRGTTPSVIIEDILALTNGVLDIRSVTIEAGAAISLQSGNPITSITPTLTDSNTDGYDDQVRIDFGGVINNPALSSGVADEQIRVFIEATVVNVIENQGGDVINNEGRLITLQDTDNDGSADDTVTLTDNVDVEIVEPVVTVAKSITSAPANPNAGDTIEYQIVIENTSDFDAFDLDFSDVLPSELDLQTGTFSATRQSDGLGVNPFFTVTTDSVTDATNFDLAAGDRITITYSATVLPTVTDGLVLTNEADVEWTSVDGANVDERGGDGDFDNPAGPGDPNDYEDESSASVTANLSPQYAFTKTISTTSSSHTGTADGTDPTITDLTIGETVTYVLTATIAEGTTPQVTIDDVIALTNGILDIRSVTISAGSNLTTDAAASFGAIIPTLIDSNFDGYDDQMTIDFGQVVNDATGTDPEDGQIRIEIEAIVVNVLANQDGDVINNEGTLTVLEDTDNDGSADDTVTYRDDVDVEIVEPSVSVAKTITSVPANPDAGDTISYQVVITNTGDIDAFDLTFSDILPDELDLEIGSFTAQRSDLVNVASLFTVDADSIVHAGTGFDLAAGLSITLTYDATVLETVRDGQNLTNEVDVEWTSTDGTSPDERGGDGDPDNPAGPGDPNDYEDEDDQSVRADLSPIYAFTKQIISTSESHTGTGEGTSATITDLVIGETVTYQLTATIGRGTTDNVQIFDVLDIANGLLDIRSVTVSAGSALSRQDGNPWDNDVTISDAQGADGYSDSVQIDFGTVINDASGTGSDEQIVVTIVAMVVNDLENQGGDVINNEGELRFLEDTDQDGTQESRSIFSDVDVEIVEPTVSVNKSITTVPTNPDAGDTVSYQIVIENTSDTDAFDITFQDLLPAELDLDTGTFTATLQSGLNNVASWFSVTADDITHAGTGFDLAAGDSIVITYDATILATVRDGQDLDNEVDIEWTSTDGVNGDERGGDGDFDNPADPTDPNNYEDEDDETFRADLDPNYAFTKEIVSTSETHTGAADGTDPAITDLTIGETVTYRLTATLGRGTTDSVQIFDVLDIANGRLDIRNVTVTAGAALSRSDGRAWDADVSISDAQGLDGYVDTVQIDFNTVVNDPTLFTAAADEQIVILIEAVVVNDGENQDGDVINNEGEFRFLQDIDEDGVQEQQSLTDDVDVEIVEPEITVTKTATSVPTDPNAGDTVSYQIVIENTGDIDAFEVDFRDALPAEMDLQTGTFTAIRQSDGLSVATWFTATADDITNGFQFDLAVGDRVTITYDATILPTVTDGLNLVNEAGAEWTSINGANADERTGDGDFDNPALGANDYESDDDATVIANLTPQYDFAKVILGTSESHTGTADGTSATITDLVVGETVTYLLTASIGEGTTNSVAIEDILDLANGTLDIRAVRISGGSNLSTSAAASFAAVTPTLTDSNGDGYFDQLDIDFGTVVNDASGTDAEDGQIRVEIDAVVVNALVNQGGDVINNLGRLTVTEDTDNDGVADDPVVREANVDVEIVEPTVDVTKTVPSGTTQADAGDVIDYRIVIENTGDIDAFDITFQDLIPAQLSLNDGSFTAIRDSDGADVSALFNDDPNQIVHVGSGFDLAAGDFITINYLATVLATVTDGLDLTNEVDIEWTSTDGDNADERGGDGDFDNPADPTDPNNYEDEDTATITGELSPLYDFTKSVYSTSESHTGTAFGTDPAITDLVVGETVTYELVAQLGRGTTPSFVIEDFLALTNGILDIRDVRIEAGAAVSLQSGNPISSIIPTITDSNVDGYDDQVEIDFGAVINNPAFSASTADEQIRIYIDAVVVNVLANQDGDVINNLGRLTVFEDTDNDGTADDPVVRESDVDVEIVEPSVTVEKQITAQPINPDGADTVSYEVVITNTGDIDAFDLTFLDDLPEKVDLDPTTFTATRNSDGADVRSFFIPVWDGSRLAGVAQDTGGFDLEAGDFITLTYDVTILETIKDGDRQTNRVDIEWTSIDGTNTDERGGDGDFDAQPDPTNPNNYEDEDDTTFIANLVGYDFEKTVYSTSQAHTGDGQHDPSVTDLTIGETVTYALTATFPEGTTPSVSIIDILSTAEGILDIESVSISAGSNLSSDQGAINSLVPIFEDPNFDGHIDKMTLVFGEVTNNASDSADPRADQLVIYVTARVVNIVENRDGDEICNNGTFSYQEDINDDGTIDGADPATTIDDCADVELVEPELTIDKTVNNDKPKLAETLTYTLTITNDGASSSADAFDLDILDRLPTGLTVDPSSVTLTHVGTPTNPTSITANNSDAQNLRLELDRLDLGESIIITYEATVTSDISYYMAVLPNEADLEWTSTPGDTPGERGGDGDPDTDADPTLTPDFYDDNDDESVEVHQPDLKITKRDGGAQIRPGQTITYTMVVTNQGRATALEVKVTDDINRYLAEGFQFVSASDGGRLNAAGVVVWNLPDLAVDETNTLTLTLRAPGVIPAGVEQIENLAVADHLDIEPSPKDNRDREDTPITATPDLVVSKDDGLTYADVGDQVTYRITFDNVGNQVASGVVIRDTLPPGVKFLSASDGGRLRGNTVVWEISELRPGDGDTFTVTVEILTEGKKVNIVTINDDGRGGPDPTPNNNRDTDETISRKGLQFDLNQNFLFSDGNQAHHSIWRDHLFRMFPEYEMPELIQNSRIPIVLATHMNSGLAQPGSTITLEVYNNQGELIGEQSVVADTGGNWLATFVTDKVNEQPARIVMKQTWSTSNVGDDTGYNFRTYFAPTFSTATYYTEELSIWNVTGKRAATEVLDLYEASKNVLFLDWNGTIYEFNARGGLQSASGN